MKFINPAKEVTNRKNCCRQEKTLTAKILGKFLRKTAEILWKLSVEARVYLLIFFNCKHDKLVNQPGVKLLAPFLHQNVAGLTDQHG